jgi:hypothetical protein
LRLFGDSVSDPTPDAPIGWELRVGTFSYTNDFPHAVPRAPVANDPNYGEWGTLLDAGTLPNRFNFPPLGPGDYDDVDVVVPVDPIDGVLKFVLIGSGGPGKVWLTNDFTGCQVACAGTYLIDWLICS